MCRNVAGYIAQTHRFIYKYPYLKVEEQDSTKQPTSWVAG